MVILDVTLHDLIYVLVVCGIVVLVLIALSYFRR
jgi:hypothetical protein